MKSLWTVIILLFAIPTMADIQTDMINDRLDRLDREMTLLQKKVYTFNSNDNTSITAPTKSSLDELYTQLDEQNKTISDLTQKVEELLHEQTMLREDLNRLNADTQFRFQEQTKSVPQKPEKQTVKTAPKDDKEAYNQAYNLLMKAKYADAEQAFTTFLKDYPDSKLAGNANYWLGETYYVRGQYDVAAGVFSDGLTKYEKSTKAPDNLLKLALTMAKLNKKAEACGFLNLLPEKFPQAEKTLKQRAEQEAKTLSCP